jgi:hypothetical protein
MKRVNLNNTKTEQPHFIGSWNIENDNLCNEIITFFEENQNLQKSGSTALGTQHRIKKTTDILIKPDDLKDIKFKCFNNYINELYKSYKDYQNQWPFLKEVIKEIDIGSFNVQRYSPGDHFAKIHTERASINCLHRVFAWMTYLNDVNEENGGKTYFSHHDIRVKPEMGKTLIWPAEWTHAHAGEILNSGFKYIVTGWMHFPHDDNSEEQEN